MWGSIIPVFNKRETENELRNKRKALVADVAASLQEAFEMRKESGNFLFPVISQWREVLPGCFVKSIPPLNNGISLYMWEFTKDVDFPNHCHTSNETFFLIRGAIDVYYKDDKKAFRLDDHSKYGTLPKDKWHYAKVTEGTIVITSYKPPVYFGQDVPDEENCT